MTVDKELFGDNLPTYLTRFVGRDREIATVLSLLLPGRLVTICGAGGANVLWVVDRQETPRGRRYSRLYRSIAMPTVGV